MLPHTANTRRHWETETHKLLRHTHIHTHTHVPVIELRMCVCHCGMHNACCSHCCCGVACGWHCDTLCTLHVAPDRAPKANLQLSVNAVARIFYIMPRGTPQHTHTLIQNQIAWLSFFSLRLRNILSANTAKPAAGNCFSNWSVPQ